MRHTTPTMLLDGTMSLKGRKPCVEQKDTQWIATGKIQCSVQLSSSASHDG